MGKKVEELDKASDSESFEFLGSEKRLSQVNVFDDLKRNKLGHMHGSAAGRRLSELPPVLAKECRILVRLQALERDEKKLGMLTSSMDCKFCSRNETSMRLIVILGLTSKGINCWAAFSEAP